MENLLRTKTFWAGLAGIVAAAAGYFTGEMEMGTAIQTALTGLIGIFLRHGVAKTGAA